MSLYEFRTQTIQTTKPSFSSSPSDTHCYVCPAHCTDFISVSDWLDKTFSVVLSNKKKCLLDLRGLKLSLMLLQLNISGFYELSSRSAKQRVQKCEYQIRKCTHTHFLLLQPMSMKYGHTSATYKIAWPLLLPLLQQTEVTNLKENLRTQRQER